MLTQSEETGALAAALAKAQSQMRVAGQTGRNPMFRNQGNPQGTAFSTHADFIQATSDALTGNGLTRVLVHTEVDEASRVFAVGVLRHGESGQWISARLPLLYAKSDMQGLKSALTYATRMLTQILTGCASGESEDDGNGAQPAAPKAKSPVKAMEDAARGLQRIRTGSRAEAQAVLEWAEDATASGKIRSTVLDSFRAAYEERFSKEVSNV